MGGMRFLPSRTHGKLNGRTFDPERICGGAMYNPHYRSLASAHNRFAPPALPGLEVEERTDTEDSGAFQERDMLSRLTAEDALERQLAHEAQIRTQVPGFRFGLVVTYDMLVGVDEALVTAPNGTQKRVKRRGTAETARGAVEETLKSAAVYHRLRDRVAGGIAYSAQGAEPERYLACVEELLALVRPGRDWLALGGFCILGMQHGLLPQFAEVVARAVPRAAAAGCVGVHVLGVAWHPALQILATACHEHGIIAQTDTSSLEQNGIFGKVWTAPDPSPKSRPWRKVYGPEAKICKRDGILGDAPPGRYHPADLALENIARFDAWGRSLTPAPVAATA